MTILQPIAIVVLAVAAGCRHDPRTPLPPRSTPGVTDQVIRLGTHTTLSGPLAEYGDITRGAQAYFDEVNAHGGVNGRRIEFLVADGADDIARTKSEVRRLVEDEHIFAIFNPVATPGQLAVIPYLDERGVPSFFMASGDTRFFQPFQHLLFPFNPPYRALGAALARYVLGHPQRHRYGVIYLDRDSGREFVGGIHNVLGDWQPEVERAVAIGEDLAPVVQALAAAEVDTVFVFLFAGPLTDAIRAGKAIGFQARWLTSFEDNLNHVGGGDVEGVFAALFLDPAAMPGHTAIMKRWRPETRASEATIGGQGAAELMVEVLRRAGRDLTREGAIRAAESIRGFKCSVCMVPADMGPDDHQPFNDYHVMVLRQGHWVEPEP